MSTNNTTQPIKILNQIKVADDKTTPEQWIHGVRYFVCHICGRMSYQKRTRNGNIYCSKHYKQEWRHHQILDHNPRTGNDGNEIRIYNDRAEIDIYDKLGNVAATAIIDPEFAEDVSTIKWSLGTGNYVLTNQDKHKKRNSLHHFVTGLDNTHEIDHINHNPLDNRLCNLRDVSHAENIQNAPAEALGVKLRENGTWLAGITEQNNAIHLGLYDTKQEALYARIYAEQQLHRFDYQNKTLPNISLTRAKEIETKVDIQLRKYIDIDNTGILPPLAWNNPDRPKKLNRKGLPQLSV